jgi:hypothetical protein
MQELTKHPYFSSNINSLENFRKTWYRSISFEGEGQASKTAETTEAVSHWKAIELTTILVVGALTRENRVSKKDQSGKREVGPSRRE